MTKSEYISYKKLLKKQIECRLQEGFGNYWVVSHMTNQSVTFAFINCPNCKSDRSRQHTGLFVEITQMGDSFFSRVETPRDPSFPLESGIRSQFYIDLGRLYADHELLHFVKESIRELSLLAIKTAEESLKSLIRS